ncbi:MAG: hypothetical protein ACTHNQ_00640 [Microbacterium sp.]|uniref:hypothetical protein n=1 Tax=Microbacterium sp. TaxID=51671 RepID=UPI003F7E3BB7
MILRATTVTLGFAAAAVMLSGCVAPAPEPTPTSTAVFASEDEAFAAAEETYRAYIEAENARSADPASRPEPQSFLVGAALEADIEANREFEARGISIVGTSSIVSLDGISADLATGDVTVQTCLDSSMSRVLDGSGADITPPDRDPTVAAVVSLMPVGNSLRISDIAGTASESC